MSSPTCFVLGHGHGVRVSQLTGGACKGLLPIGNTSIVANLLDAVIRAGLHPIVTARATDDELGAFVRATGVPSVLLEPKGYINDLNLLTVNLRDVIVIDCDTVVAPADLDEILNAMLVSSMEMIITLSAGPLSDDPRSIRPVVVDRRIRRITHDARAPRTAGIYRFRGNALRLLTEFATLGLGTFHDFMDELARLEIECEALTLDVAFNVNWPADYWAAAAWWGNMATVIDERSAMSPLVSVSRAVRSNSLGLDG